MSDPVKDPIDKILDQLLERAAARGLTPTALTTAVSSAPGARALKNVHPAFDDAEPEEQVRRLRTALEHLAANTVGAPSIELLLNPVHDPDEAKRQLEHR
jgi:hypothetical protein